jgi:hypothetical protein
LIAWRREIRANFLHHSNSRSDVWSIEHDPFPTEIRAFHAALGRYRGPDWPVRSRSKVRIRLGLVYGIFVLVGFFLARLAVNTTVMHSLPFVALAVILTPIGGVAAVSAGSLLRRVVARKRMT